MKLSGAAVLKAGPDQVWAALNDPAVLARCIPGCQSLEPVGADEYKMTVSAGVASIRGTYDGQVRLSDKQEPTSYVMHASGAGGPGTVSATCTITLTGDEDKQSTELKYDADAIVGGVVAGVGQRMITGVAKKLAGEFFGNVNAELTGSGGAPAKSVDSDSAAEKSPAESGTDAAPGPAVFAGRAASSASAGPVGVDPRSALLGAGIALLGVLLGGLLARKRS